MKYLLLVGIRIYRLLISPLFPPACRFHPSCSTYAEEAIRRHGIGRGTILVARRLIRCRPMGPHGFDPVP